MTGDNNRLLTDGTYDYTYDDEGNRFTRENISSGEITTYGWDHRNRLISVTTVDALDNVLLEAVFTYDVFNNLIIRWIDADGEGVGEAEILATVYTADHAWADFNGDGDLLNHYLYSDHVDEIMARIDAEGAVDWYLSDNIGTVRQIADTDGNILDEIDYDSFGNIVNETTPTAGVRFTFTARERESAVDLYFYRARWYDAADGQFISEDPIHFEAPDANLRRYVLNSPTNSIDPSGLTTCSVSTRGVVKYFKPSNVRATFLIVSASATLSPNPKSETVTDDFDCVRERDVQVEYTCTQRYGVCWLSTRTFTYFDVFTQVDVWPEHEANIALRVSGYDLPMGDQRIGPVLNFAIIHPTDKPRADQICKDREKLHPWPPFTPPATTPPPF